jgi:hypothetical protein
MKKEKSIIAALVSAVITAALSVSLTANAIVDFRNDEILTKLLEGNGYPLRRSRTQAPLKYKNTH